jgi:hypothetical protein
MSSIEEENTLCSGVGGKSAISPRMRRNAAWHQAAAAAGENKNNAGSMAAAAKSAKKKICSSSATYENLCSPHAGGAPGDCGLQHRRRNTS